MQIGFVRLNDARQMEIALFNRFLDSVCQVPCSLIAHAEVALQLARGGAFFSLADESSRHEPCSRGQMRMVEARA